MGYALISRHATRWLGIHPRFFLPFPFDYVNLVGTSAPPGVTESACSNIESIPFSRTERNESLAVLAKSVVDVGRECPFGRQCPGCPPIRPGGCFVNIRGSPFVDKEAGERMSLWVRGGKRIP